jgi:hypothetical protein
MDDDDEDWEEYDSHLPKLAHTGLSHLHDFQLQFFWPTVGQRAAKNGLNAERAQATSRSKTGWKEYHRPPAKSKRQPPSKPLALPHEVVHYKVFYDGECQIWFALLLQVTSYIC